MKHLQNILAGIVTMGLGYGTMFLQPLMEASLGNVFGTGETTHPAIQQIPVIGEYGLLIVAGNLLMGLGALILLIGLLGLAYSHWKKDSDDEQESQAGPQREPTHPEFAPD